ncbi:MAG: fumarylacetoacetate hydrolase family protein [Fimbriiglobus sp.]
MRFAKLRSGAVVRVDESGAAVPLDLTRIPGIDTLAAILASPDPIALAAELVVPGTASVPLSSLFVAAPVDRQEIWAAGVTYKRSKQAREEESQGAAVFYDKVYAADRPELFFKATPERVSGPGQPIRVRRDSRWSVPEPELTLVISPDLRIVGYTIGNDVSSRDIEGENPLYLPQAKVYAGSCGLGPVVTPVKAMPPLADVQITLTIRRSGTVVFEGATGVSAMHRTTESLVDWLGRENHFPHGVMLMTGTGIVPPDSFTLSPGDTVAIAITGIGVLENPVS